MISIGIAVIVLQFTSVPTNKHPWQQKYHAEKRDCKQGKQPRQRVKRDERDEKEREKTQLGDKHSHCPTREQMEKRFKADCISLYHRAKVVKKRIKTKTPD